MYVLTVHLQQFYLYLFEQVNCKTCLENVWVKEMHTWKQNCDDALCLSQPPKLHIFLFVRLVYS